MVGKVQSDCHYLMVGKVQSHCHYLVVGRVHLHTPGSQLKRSLTVTDGGVDCSHVVVEDGQVTGHLVGAQFNDVDGSLVEPLRLLAVLGPVGLVTLLLQAPDALLKPLLCNSPCQHHVNSRLTQFSRSLMHFLDRGQASFRHRFMLALISFAAVVAHVNSSPSLRL